MADPKFKYLSSDEVTIIAVDRPGRVEESGLTSNRVRKYLVIHWCANIRYETWFWEWELKKGTKKTGNGGFSE